LPRTPCGDLPVIYDALGSNTAWRIGVALGLAGGIIQVAFALIKPTAPPLMRTAQALSAAAHSLGDALLREASRGTVAAKQQTGIEAHSAA
jgi:hypothetical protein